MLRTLTLFVLLLSFQDCFSLNHRDEEEIAEIVNSYVDAWNYNGGHGYAKGFSPDSVFVNPLGMVFYGAEEIEERHVAILESFLKGSSYTVLDLRMREVDPNVTIAFVLWQVDGFRDPNSDPSEEGRTIMGVMSHVFQRTEGAWSIIASQGTISQL